MHRADDERDSFAVVDALRRLVRELRESARIAQGRAQITGAQLFVLRTIVDRPGLSINELAEATMTHQSSVSVVVSRLVERGLVSRAPASDDRRRMVVTATARGRAAQKAAPAVAQEKLVDAVREMAPAQRRALAEGLVALVNGLGVAGGEPSMFFEDEGEHESGSARNKQERNARSHV